MSNGDQDAGTLSVGQQQRVAVARALACRPALVLADEPTASLDTQNARAALDLLQNACRSAGAALLCTSHDPSIRDRFARVETVDAYVRRTPAEAAS
jgi:ABC-type lipoprotein export system ATPase subunit